MTEEDDYFCEHGFLFSPTQKNDDNDNPSRKDSTNIKSWDSSEGSTNEQLFETEIRQLQIPFSVKLNQKDIYERRIIIEKYMGSMALTRGKLGDVLREAGALTSLLSLLHMIICNYIGVFPTLVDKNIVGLVTIALGALRDLACGNSLNRQSIANFTIHDGVYTDNNTPINSGIDIISFFVKRYHGVSWESILSLPNSVDKEVVNVCEDHNDDKPTERGKSELKMMTAAIGVIRNATHSTRKNCEAFHKYGITEHFIWRLRYNETNKSSVESSAFLGSNEPTQISRLPNASKPWREASFRIASSLINMSEKCIEVAEYCAMDDNLIYLLLESWGGVSIFNGSVPKKGYPVLHLGLNAILKKRLLDKTSRSGTEALENLIKTLFERECIRKKLAQSRELQRKAKKSCKKKMFS